MDFALSETQELLRNAARDFLQNECPKSAVRELAASKSGYSPQIWKKMSQMGWPGLAIPSEYGGGGGSLLDLGVLFEELGRAAYPGPMFTTAALGALLILQAGNEEQKMQLLPQISKGEVILTLALSEPEVDYDPRFITTKAKPEQGRFIIDGTKLFVPHADIADKILVVVKTQEGATEEGTTIFMVSGKTSGVSITPLVTIAPDKQFDVQLSKVIVSKSDILGGLDSGWPFVDAALRRATAIQCAEMLGGAQRMLEMTKQHASTRIQFDRQIGSFQITQHRMADMLLGIEGARWTIYHALWALDKGSDARREVAIAKMWTSDACQRIAWWAHQIHGGVGTDLDYDLHFYYRQAKALEINLGAPSFHQKAIETALGI